MNDLIKLKKICKKHAKGIIMECISKKYAKSAGKFVFFDAIESNREQDQ